MISKKAHAEATEFLTNVRPRVRMVGRSHAMRRAEREGLLAARLNANVLVTGERGVGKALLARFIHEHSDRSIHGFATINCAGLPDMLVESALFGHVKGSFAGGYRDKPGLVDAVAGGTIFLNEVGNLSERMQTRLLWFLQTGEYQRMGGVRVQVQPRTNLSVRVIASTSMNLPERVAAGLFREDLYRLLNEVAITVAPLRERREDIPSLVDHFARQFAVRSVSEVDAPEISSATRDAFSRAEWPGNVGELRGAVLRQLLRAAGFPKRPGNARQRELVNS
jgi:two-component system NtrC family response regulator